MHKRYQYYKILLTLSIATALVFVPALHAANKKPKMPKVDPSTVFSVSEDGESYHCAPIKGVNVFVTANKSKYILGSQALRNLKDKLAKAHGKAKKKLARNLKQLKSRVKRGDALCKVSVPPSGETPTPSPTPPAGGGSSLTPIARALTRSDVQYLLDKAGLGLSANEEPLVAVAVNQGIDALVDEFMAAKAEPAGLLDRVSDLLDGQLNSSSTTHTAAGQRSAILDLWIHTNNPFAERFAFFLLSIWTAAGDVIEDETFRYAFWDYYSRLREYAYSPCSLPDLGLAITRDPLMLIYLNNELNVRDNPNENYARELMELFTLGPTNLDGQPNYTETALDGSGDIAVAARMLTGWKVRKDYSINKLVAQYDSTRHEPGTHLMFAGSTHQFSGSSDEDLVRGIFAHHPGVKYYYAAEILKEYLTPKPPRELVEALALEIEKHAYQLRPVMRTLFMSEAFFDPAYRDSVPVNSLEFAAKVARILGMQQAVNMGEGQRQLQQMGMQINLAPSVFWYNQDSWISSSVVLEKANFVANILADSTAQRVPEPDWSPASVLPQGSVSANELIDFVAYRLGISLTSAQRSNIEAYLSKTKQYDGSYLDFTYDNTNAQHQRSKGLGVYYLLFLLPNFQLN